jgi:hypothetical protein
MKRKKLRLPKETLLQLCGYETADARGGAVTAVSCQMTCAVCTKFCTDNTCSAKIGECCA